MFFTMSLHLLLSPSFLLILVYLSCFFFSSPRPIIRGAPNKSKAPRGGMERGERWGKEGTYRDHVHQGGLSRILEAHEGEFHLLLPEEAPEPRYDRLKEGG
jgi:hypothetical protein